MAVIGEGLPPSQPGPVPELVGQGLGGDHQRVHRHERALLAAQGPGVALGGPHHGRGPHRPALGHDDARLDRPRRRLLVDGHAAPLRRLGQTAHQSGRVDGGAVGGVGTAQHVGGPGHGGCLGGGEQTKVLWPDAGRPRLGHVAAGPLELDAGPGQHHRPASGEAAGDGLVGHHPAHLADRVDHGPTDGCARHRAHPPRRGVPRARRTAPSTTPRSGPTPRSRPRRARRRRCAGWGRPRPGSRRSTGR